MVKSILKVLKKNQIHLKKAVVCVVAMALILQSLVYYGQNYTLDAKATENQRGNMTATTSGDAKTIPLNSSGTDSLKGDGLVTDSSQGDSSGTDSPKGDGLVEDSPQENDMETDSSQGDSPRTDSLKEDGLLADSPQENDLEIDLSQDDSSGTDSSTGTAEGSATENSTGTGNDSADNQDATTSGDAKADDSETDATPEDDSEGKLDNLMAEITNSLLEMAASFSVNPNYIYLNPAGMTLGNVDWNSVTGVYINGNSWSGGFSVSAQKDGTTGYWYWDLTSWGGLDCEFSFTISTVWSTINANDYYRTSLSGITLADAKGKIFVQNGTDPYLYDGQSVYAIKQFTSLEGQTINFVDCTQLHSKVTAIFSDDNTFASSATTYKEIEVTSSTNVFSFTIPGEQKYVKFEDAKGNQLGDAYNFYGQASTGEHGIMFAEGTNDTYYYKVTEKANDNSISTWGALPPNKKLKSNTLYFDTSDFAEKPTFIVDGTTVELEDSGNGKWVYKFPEDSTATQRTMLTVLKDGVKYHFLWSDIVNSNVVKIQSDIANVTGKYIPARTVYFDATLSKLSYSDATGSNTLPGAGDVIRCYATKSSDANVYIECAMTKVNEHTVGNNKWSDVYKVDLPADYDKIVFSNYIMNGPENYGVRGNSTTTLDIPAALTNPCFYADTGDKSVYEDTLGGRGGYWDEVYTIRDAESGKSTTGSTVDVVDIKKSTFTRDAQTLYINSTFYDYYTDYELNGYNRDTYPYVSNGTDDPFPSQRNWVTFRQFNQALSDYYEGENASIPIYTGHFQTGKAADTTIGNKFRDVAGSLSLFGYDESGNYNKFFSTNNSELDINGLNTYGKKVTNSNGVEENEPLYDYTAQALVFDELQKDGKLDADGSLLMKTDAEGKIEEPHFNEDFLTGNNSKNAVLGEVYHNVSFPFTQVDRGNNGIKYWTFNSAEDTLAMRQDTNTGAYYLHKYGDGEDHDWARNVNSGSNQWPGSVSTAFGFFPFNETSTASADTNETNTLGPDNKQNTADDDKIEANTYNYGYGAKLEFDFKLTSDGKVEDKNGNKVPITFEFSGDDDVWVFIDGKLVLDVGGAHGVVNGTIDFSDNSSDEGWQMKATVDKVKSSAGKSGFDSNNCYNVASFHELTGNPAKEHTLTMFYMERGMWESNMSISFNFPDENQLEVEKVVDTSDVNAWFAPLFDNISLFEFNIKNLATHYGEKSLTEGEKPTAHTFNDYFNGSAKPSTRSFFQHEGSKDGYQHIAHWRAYYENHDAAQRDKYYGVISANTDADYNDDDDYVDISNMSYLEFEYYYDYTDTPSLSYMYLQLVDTDGNVKGNVTDYLAGKTYGMVNMAGGSWVTVKVDLTALKEYTSSGIESSGSFNNYVKYIKFGYDYPRDIYLDNFIFHPMATVNEHAGFTTKQYEIPDYGSATTGNVMLGKLAIPEGAVYSSTTGANQMIGKDGTFYLKNREKVTFKDQFRRGSYIYLSETANQLFKTSWTMYENGQIVTSYGAIDEDDATDVVTYNDAYNEITEQRLVNVEGVTVNDGRIEPYLTGNTDNKAIQNAGYTQSVVDRIKESSTEGVLGYPTFVFRSFAFPNDASMTIKLKVVYTNKVKVGSLKIAKEQKYVADNLIGNTYQFKVRFYNIGGIALEDEVIEKTVSVKAGETVTIEGIPIGTFYTVEEIKPTDDSSLDSVTLSHENVSMTLETGTNIVSGVVLEQEDEDDIPKVTFTNTKEPKISVDMTKLWNDEVTGNILDSNKQPASITVQLQRKKTGEPDTEYDEVDKFTSIKVYATTDDDDNIVWQYTASGLDKVVDYAQSNMTEWVYRFIELDSEGNEIENGKVFTLTDNSGGTGDYEVSYSAITKDLEGNHSQTITNTLLGPANLAITKQGNDGSKLESVTFKLEQKNAEGEYVDITESQTSNKYTTGSDGKAFFANLENGTYRLTETKSASGYTLLKEPIIIKIERKTDTYEWKMESDTEFEPLQAECWSETDRTLSITVSNSQNIVLPFTGGYSPIPIMAGGMALSMAASLLYINKKKRRRKEGKPPGT